MLTPIYTLLLLIASIIAIILLSTKGKFNIFFVLLIVATAVGFAAGFDGEKIKSSLTVLLYFCLAIYPLSIKSILKQFFR